MVKGLKPGDVLRSMLITESSFSNPETLSVSLRMPAKVGYFQEDLRRAQSRAIAEFKRKMEEVGYERGGTSILDGIYLYANILQQQDPGLRKVLVLISDMCDNRYEII